MKWPNVKFVQFDLRKRLLKKKRKAAEENPIPALPGVERSNFVKSFPCKNVPGDIWIYKWGKWYELVVAGSYGGSHIDAFFKLKGRHRKLEAAEKRAAKVARNWGKE